MSTRTLRGRCVVPGVAEGEALVTHDRISGWGGIDSRTGTIVEVDHPKRGKYLSVGNPIKLSDSISDVRRSPLLGEHTDEILTKVLKFTPREIAQIKASGATGDAPKAQAAE